MALADDIWGAFGGSPGFGSGDPSNTSPTAATGGGGASSQGSIGAGLGLAGLGIDLLGSQQASKAAAASAQSSMQIAGLEEQQNQQRQLAMQISARRQQTETIRNAQRQRALSQTTAANQGASMGSGAAGAYAGIQGMAAYNLQGTNQNLQIGNTLFGLDAQISTQRIAMAQDQSSQASASGLSSLGGALMKSAPMLASLALG